MKKSLLALAVLGAFAGAASAQSSVTLYGLIDTNIGKDIGSKAKRMAQGATSRLGVRGVEDIGGGLKATFQFEHRFDPTTGESNVPFWQARSTVGLMGGFGAVKFGREYTEAFWIQLAADPWGYDTVASLAPYTSGGVAKNRNNNSATYSVAFGGLTFGIQAAETNDNGTAKAPTASATSTDVVGPATQTGTSTEKKPVNMRLAYAGGPFEAGLAIENPGDKDDQWNLLRLAYTMGGFKLGFFYGQGQTEADLDRKSLGLTGVMSMGAGQLRVGYGDLKGQAAANGSNLKLRNRLSLGYHYSLSKRTVLYADLARDKSDVTALTADGKKSDNAYDLGIKHSF
jgi:predicted porin